MEGILRDVLTVPHHANIKMVAKLFEAHSPNRVYVTDKGTLVGCIFKRHLVADGWTKPQHADIAQASGVDTSVWQPKRPGLDSDSERYSEPSAERYSDRPSDASRRSFNSEASSDTESSQQVPLSSSMPEEVFEEQGITRGRRSFVL